ncbi:vomeronasal type-2 receptor 26-like, partial [Bombina bombina]|uniref:vomeronasal type-2 receptor 26-like n=1 Tax=Bombina bombina TaxID=8345 RepID=UPI00235A8A18
MPVASSPLQMATHIRSGTVGVPHRTVRDQRVARKTKAERPHANVRTPRSVCSEICPTGSRKSLQNGNLSCCFECALCSDGEISNITDMDNCVKCPDGHWPNLNKDMCIRNTIDFLSLEDPLGSAFAAIAILFSLITNIVFLVFVRNRTTPIVKANNLNLSYILLVSLEMSFLCSLFFIGHPENVTCIIRQAAFGFTFTVAIASVLAKTLTVVLAFNATKPGNKLNKWMGCRMSLGLIIACSLGELVIDVTWVVYSPPFMEFETKTIPGKTIVQCNEGSMLAFYLVISYIGVLALITLIVAFIARKLPDSFNESQYISFSMLVVCSVWVSFIPTYLSTKGKYMVAMEIFTILASTGGLLGCIYFPKYYIIILKPELNCLKKFKY